jgi:hypothetical protein
MGDSFAFLLALILVAPSPNASQKALPAGVDGVYFGKAERYRDPSGKEMCAIPKPLPPPAAFERGVTEISYGVMLQPRVVKSASARVTSPAGQELQSVVCNIFMPIAGGFSQTQLGSTISRTDNNPLRSGTYTLQNTVDGQVAEIRFTVK